MTPKTRNIPYYESVSGGKPIPDDWQNYALAGFRDVREIDSANPFEKFAAARVEGESLAKLGILSGDILIYKITAKYQAGSIGIWQTPHGQTAKFARSSDGTVTLHNQNGWTESWSAEEIKLLGVCVRVERDLV